MGPVLDVKGLEKTFVLHTQGGVRLPVLKNSALTVESGECVVLSGPSGAGKSTLLRCVYGNYKAGSGEILVRSAEGTVDMARAAPRTVLRLRRTTIGYVTQFLRTVPRVPAIDIVTEPMLALGMPMETARERAETLLIRLGIPERLWGLAPATFSGGEQQRVNIARGFAVDFPLFLLDEPTAALDATNRNVVIDLIEEARFRGAAIVGIFHGAEVRDAVATRVIDMATLAEAA